MSSAVAAQLSLERTLSQDDFDAFARLSGDANPIHVDPRFAARTRFGRTVAHGVLLYSILRGLVARLVPDARQLRQHVTFPAPTFAGEPLRFTARVRARTGRDVTLELEVLRLADATVTCCGETVVRTVATP